MAKINTAETAGVTKTFNSKIGPIRDAFVIRPLFEGFHLAKTGNKCIKRQFEIVSPETIEVNGETIQMAGVKLGDSYVTLEVVGDIEKTKKSIAKYKEDLAKLGIQVEEEIDTDQPTLFLKDNNILIDAIVSTQESMQRKNPTPEQLRKGQLGDPIKDPATGKPIVRYQLQLSDILGVSSGQAASNSAI